MPMLPVLFEHLHSKPERIECIDNSLPLDPGAFGFRAASEVFAGYVGVIALATVMVRPWNAILRTSENLVRKWSTLSIS